jgi:cystathionine beta-lyase/cystathionine gamma-synthase
MAHGSSTKSMHPVKTKGKAPAALNTPIYETTTFVFDNAEALRQYHGGGTGDYFYSRYENPTVTAVESVLAQLDGSERSLLFASGMAATSTTLLALLRAEDEVVCSAGIYGGTYRFLKEVLPRLGIASRFVRIDSFTDPKVLFSPKTRIVWFESPINPHLRCVDVAAVAAACRANGVVSVLDNTFATPLNQRPFELGVDLAMQSGSKYLGGHSDVTAGVISGPAGLLGPVESMRRALGGVLDPQPAYLLERSLKTLTVRIAAHNANALAVARALEGHPKVKRVDYPGLPSHPDHALASRQMSGFGGMVNIDLRGGERAACQAFDRLQLIRRAASLGGVESLCSLPFLTTHWGHSDAELAEAGVTRGMVRLSIGLEDADDLIADITQAIA